MLVLFHVLIKGLLIVSINSLHFKALKCNSARQPVRLDKTKHLGQHVGGQERKINNNKMSTSSKLMNCKG